MKTQRSHLFVTLLLTFAALVFGMVLAGGNQLTTPGYSAEGPQRVASQAASVGTPATPSTVTLPSFADLADAVLPAVVTVNATTIQTGQRGGRSPFEFFFGQRGNPENPRNPGEGSPREFRSDGAGSGFVITSDGWIVTNNHVVEGASTVTVILEGEEIPADVHGRDAATDLALLKVELERSLPYLTLGDSERLRVGDWVMAVGSPLTLSQSITVGIVSAKGRSRLGISDRSFENFIQTDAAINRGNSGGPLVNLAGEVIGINTAMNFGAENIGFAVPVSTLENVLDQLQTNGRVRRGYLGVEITDLDRDAAEAFGVDSTDGALIQEVRDGSPAQEGGLRKGDIIVRVDGEAVRNNRELIDYVS
ncbi:MAG: trypsin-like peptidase domain-containing protein, partial [Acidobacteriota bacterium]|nr:trypsin-like peptidase domain-containing protein [Acidobacteriota bacterium]